MWARTECSEACGIFRDQGLNPCPLHWQADLNHWTTRELPQFFLRSAYSKKSGEHGGARWLLQRIPGVDGSGELDPQGPRPHVEPAGGLSSPMRLFPWLPRLQGRRELWGTRVLPSRSLPGSSPAGSALLATLSHQRPPPHPHLRERHLVAPRLSPGFGVKRDKQVVGAVIRARYHPIWGPGTPPRTPDGTTRSRGVESSLFLSPRGMCRLLMSTAVSFFFFIVSSPVKGPGHRVCAQHWGLQRACPWADPLMRGPPGQTIRPVLTGAWRLFCSLLCFSGKQLAIRCVSFYRGPWWLQAQVSTQSCARAREFPETL